MMAKDRPRLLGHRGLSLPNGPPENTLAAFDRAIQDGCDGFEFDVRLTADGKAVVCHEPQYQGMEVARAQAAELKALPLLDDIIDRYRQRSFLDIELKVAGLEAKLVHSLGDSQQGVLVSSFLPHVLRDLSRRSAAIPLGLICQTREELALWRQLPVRSVIAHRQLVSKELITQIHAAGKEIFVWTVNRPDEMRRFEVWGADGLISDDPELLVSTLRPGTR